MTDELASEERALCEHFRYLGCPVPVDTADVEDCAGMAVEVLRFLTARGWRPRRKSFTDQPTMYEDRLVQLKQERDAAFARANEAARLSAEARDHADDLRAEIGKLKDRLANVEDERDRMMRRESNMYERIRTWNDDPTTRLQAFALGWEDITEARAERDVALAQLRTITEQRRAELLTSPKDDPGRTSQVSIPDDATREQLWVEVRRLDRMLRWMYRHFDDSMTTGLIGWFRLRDSFEARLVEPEKTVRAQIRATLLGVIELMDTPANEIEWPLPDGYEAVHAAYPAGRGLLVRALADLVAPEQEEETAGG